MRTPLRYLLVRVSLHFCKLLLYYLELGQYGRSIAFCVRLRVFCPLLRASLHGINNDTDEQVGHSEGS